MREITREEHFKLVEGYTNQWYSCTPCDFTDYGYTVIVTVWVDIPHRMVQDLYKYKQEYK